MICRVKAHSPDRRILFKGLVEHSFSDNEVISVRVVCQIPRQIEGSKINVIYGKGFSSMSHYLRVLSYPDRTVTQVWNIEGNRATTLGVANPEQGAGSFFEAESGETIWEAIPAHDTVV